MSQLRVNVVVAALALIATAGFHHVAASVAVRSAAKAPKVANSVELHGLVHPLQPSLIGDTFILPTGSDIVTLDVNGSSTAMPQMTKSVEDCTAVAQIPGTSVGVFNNRRNLTAFDFGRRQATVFTFDSKEKNTAGYNRDHLWTKPVVDAATNLTFFALRGDTTKGGLSYSIYSVNATSGQRHWSRTDSFLSPYLVAPSAVVNGFIYTVIGSFPTGFYAQTGDIAWQCTSANCSRATRAVAADNKYLYFSIHDELCVLERVCAIIAPSAGTQTAWCSEILGDAPIISIKIEGGLLVVTSRVEGGSPSYILDPATGKTLAQIGGYTQPAGVAVHESELIIAQSNWVASVPRSGTSINFKQPNYNVTAPGVGVHFGTNQHLAPVVAERASKLFVVGVNNSGEYEGNTLLYTYDL